jgi:hypothetical protein
MLSDIFCVQFLPINDLIEKGRSVGFDAENILASVKIRVMKTTLWGGKYIRWNES